jgi:hypothetical protein
MIPAPVIVAAIVIAAAPVPVADRVNPQAMAVLEAAQKVLDGARSLTATVEQGIDMAPPPDSPSSGPYVRQVRRRAEVRLLKPNYSFQRVTTELAPAVTTLPQEWLFVSDGTTMHEFLRTPTKQGDSRDIHLRGRVYPGERGPRLLLGSLAAPLVGFFGRRDGQSEQFAAAVRVGSLRAVRLAPRETFEGAECDVVEIDKEQTGGHVRYYVGVKDRLIRRIVDATAPGRTTETVLRDVRLDPPLAPADFAFTPLVLASSPKTPGAAP